MAAEEKATRNTRKRYDRIAPIYDLVESLVERSRYSHWRRLLWSKVEGNKILEIGVGTGKNFPYYPPDTRIIAVDFSERMEVPEELEGKFKFARQKSKLAGIIRGSFFVIKGEY